MESKMIFSANPHLKLMKPYVPGMPIEELDRKYTSKKIIKLASNENPLGPSEGATLAALNATFQNSSRYPDSNSTVLKNALSTLHLISSDQIVVGNGSNEILDLIARLFSNKCSDEVIISEYAFAAYELIVRAIGAIPVITKAEQWGHNLDLMLKSITKNTRLIFIANPNNPTGTYISIDALKRFIALVPDHIVIVIDEAYCEYVEKADYQSAAVLLEQNPNLIIVRTFSKIYGLAGLRIGYCLSNANIADFIGRVRQPFNVNSIGLAAAASALKDVEHLQRSKDINQKGMQHMMMQLDVLNINYISSVGNFLCVELGKNAGLIYSKLLKKGVIVRPLKNYNMAHHLRVTIGLPEENAAFLNALSECLKCKSLR